MSVRIEACAEGAYEGREEEGPWVLADGRGGVLRDHGRDEVAEQERTAEAVKCGQRELELE